ncbi:MAG: HAD-IIB family hydrolase [Propionibacteriaceae bacterium]|nr:HAD-IIB family hydrolase [Propionibacteriaceae bacterium]
MTIDLARVRLIAFDLDDTLAESKSPMTPEMAQALAHLLDDMLVCIISGGHFKQFDEQVLGHLPPGTNLANLHLLPTCGTRYMIYEGGGWRELYSQNLTDDEKSRAIRSLFVRAHEVGAWEPDDKISGPRIEDRGTQITYSALGQRALPAYKRAWDPSGVKRHALAAAVAADVPDLSVGAGGSTSIDITRRGVDKAYGLQHLSQQTGVPLDDMVFVGDRTEPGGNDYPVVQLGVATIPVTGWRDTMAVVTQLCDQLKECR